MIVLRVLPARCWALLHADISWKTPINYRMFDPKRRLANTPSVRPPPPSIPNSGCDYAGGTIQQWRDCWTGVGPGRKTMRARALCSCHKLLQ